MKIINPATGQLLKEIEDDGILRVREKFEQAVKAQKKWAKTSLTSRVETLKKFRESIVAKTDELALLLTQEVGKPITQSHNELKGLLARIDFFFEHTAGVLRDQVVLKDESQGLTEMIAHEPLGVIANISAWNYPYFVGSNVFIPALLTGNAVLYKPSEFATLTGLAIAKLLHEAGVPEDVFVPIVGEGHVGAELIKQNVQGIFFTGSYATGKAIATAAASKLVRLQLELGGKDPIYVGEDVDIPSVAAAVADGAFYNTGQSCCSVERIYVHAAIYPAFVEAFLHCVRDFVVGDPLDIKTYIGPITREPHLAYLTNQVEDAKAKGARLLCGGKRAEMAGFYFEPTVFADVNHTMELMREETFGPLIGIQKVDSDEEAVKLMNDTAYGLTAGVYTKDEERAKRILSEINSGSVYWNACDRVSPRLPWSGRCRSGIGCTLSTYGIEAFTQLKAWHLKR